MPNRDHRTPPQSRVRQTTARASCCATAQGRWPGAPAADPRNRPTTAAIEVKIAGPLRGPDAVGHASLARRHPRPRQHGHPRPRRDAVEHLSDGKESWHGFRTAYFVPRAKDLAREHRRHRIWDSKARPQWDRAALGGDLLARFDVTAKDASAAPAPSQRSRHPWLDRGDRPLRSRLPHRTRVDLGRFAREGVAFRAPEVGKPVLRPSGDVAQCAYLPRCVSRTPCATRPWTKAQLMPPRSTPTTPAIG